MSLGVNAALHPAYSQCSGLGDLFQVIQACLDHGEHLVFVFVTCVGEEAYLSLKVPEAPVQVALELCWGSVFGDGVYAEYRGLILVALFLDASAGGNVPKLGCLGCVPAGDQEGT